MYAYLTFVGFGNSEVKLVEERNDGNYMTRKTELYFLTEDQKTKLNNLKQEGNSLIPFIRTNCNRIK